MKRRLKSRTPSFLDRNLDKIITIFMCIVTLFMVITMTYKYFRSMSPHYKVGQCYSHDIKATENFESDYHAIIVIDRIGHEKYGYRLWLGPYGFNETLDADKFDRTEDYYSNSRECPKCLEKEKNPRGWNCKDYEDFNK